MAELTVRKKGYYRKPYVRKGGVRVEGSHVEGSTFKIKDRGAPGRGEKVIDVKEGGLGGEGFFEKPKQQQHFILGGVVRREGKQVAMGRLRALQVFNKRTNPKVSREAAQLARYVQTEY